MLTEIHPLRWQECFFLINCTAASCALFNQPNANTLLNHWMAEHTCRLHLVHEAFGVFRRKLYHSESTGVISMRGGLMKGNVVGRQIISSSGVRDRSVCRHDSGGSCRFPEKRRRPRRRSTPRVQAGDVKDSLRVQSGGSLLSCRDTEKEIQK